MTKRLVFVHQSAFHCHGPKVNFGNVKITAMLKLGVRQFHEDEKKALAQKFFVPKFWTLFPNLIATWAVPLGCEEIVSLLREPLNSLEESKFKSDLEKLKEKVIEWLTKQRTVNTFDLKCVTQQPRAQASKKQKDIKQLITDVVDEADDPRAAEVDLRVNSEPLDQAEADRLGLSDRFEFTALKHAIVEEILPDDRSDGVAYRAMLRLGHEETGNRVVLKTSRLIFWGMKADRLDIRDLLKVGDHVLVQVLDFRKELLGNEKYFLAERFIRRANIGIVGGFLLPDKTSRLRNLVNTLGFQKWLQFHQHTFAEFAAKLRSSKKYASFPPLPPRPCFMPTKKKTMFKCTVKAIGSRFASLDLRNGETVIVESSAMYVARAFVGLKIDMNLLLKRGDSTLKCHFRDFYAFEIDRLNKHGVSEKDRPLFVPGFKKCLVCMPADEFLPDSSLISTNHFSSQTENAASIALSKYFKSRGLSVDAYLAVARYRAVKPAGAEPLSVKPERAGDFQRRMIDWIMNADRSWEPAISSEEEADAAIKVLAQLRRVMDHFASQTIDTPEESEGRDKSVKVKSDGSGTDSTKSATKAASDPAQKAGETEEIVILEEDEPAEKRPKSADIADDNRRA